MLLNVGTKEQIRATGRREMTVWIFILYALATWRISHVVAYEDGPYDVFDTFRKRAEKYETFGKLVSCLKCLSVWVAGAMSVTVAMSVDEFIVYTASLSAAAILFDAFVEHLEK